MVRPNGSVIGRDSESGELDKDAVMPKFALPAARSPLNLGTLRGLHNPSTAPVSSNPQRVGPGAGASGWAGSGNADAAGTGAAVSLGFFATGFGRIGLAGFGGVTGCNSATTGLGSILVVAAVK